MKSSLFCLSLFIGFGALTGSAQTPAPGTSIGPSWVTFFTPNDFGGTEMGSITGGVWTAVLDRRGFLYVGTNGVREYDGAKWRHIDVGADWGVHLAVGEDDRIWVSGMNAVGYLALQPDGRRHYVSLRDKLPDARSDEIARPVIRARGRTHYLFTQSLAIWDDSSFSRLPIPLTAQTGRSPRPPGAFLLGEDVVVNQPGSNSWIFEDQQLVPAPLPESMRAERIAFVVPRGAHRHWVGLGRGLAELSGDEWRSSAASSGVRSLLSHAVRLGADSTLVCSADEGALIVHDEGAVLRRLGLGGASSRGRFGGVTFDSVRRKAVLAMPRAVAVLSPDSATCFFSSADFFEGAELTSFAVGDDGTVAVTTQGGLFVGAVPGEGPLTFKVDRKPRARVSSVDGRVFVSSLPGIAALVRGEAIPVISHPQFSFNDPVPSWIHPGRFYYVTNEDRGLRAAEKQGEAWRSLDFSWTPTPANGASYVCEDAQGGMWWMTNGRTLWRRRPDGTQDVFKQADQLPAGFTAYGIFPLRNGLYAYSPYQALRYADGKWARVPALERVTIRQCETRNAQYEDSWLLVRAPGRAPGTGIALARYVSQGGGRLDVYEAPELSREERVLGINRDPDGKHVWVGALSGLYRFSIAELRLVGAPPLPTVVGLRWSKEGGEELLSPSRPVRLDYAPTGGLTVSVRNLETMPEGPHTVQTRLEGMEANWTTTSGDRTISGIPSGRYTLQYRLLNVLGEAGPIGTLPLQIVPPLYRSPLAAVLYGLGACLIGGWIVRWRVKETARRNAELQRLVKERTDQLTEAVAAKSQFLSNMGHEIRNPMNGLVGLVDALADRPLPNDQRVIVRSLAACATYLSSVVDDVLDYAEIDAGRISLRIRPFVLGALVEEAVALMKCHGKSEIIVAMPEDLRTRVVAGDADRLRRILVNYLANARKFAPGAAIRVTVKAEPGDHVVFAVMDEGPGIKLEEQAKLFQRFSRGSAAREQNIPGTGLGLASCRAYAEAMGGRVWVESVLGKGSTFFVAVPLRSAVLADAALEQTVKTNLFVGRSVLVVDDQEFNRLAVADLLRRKGAHVDVACGVAAASETFSAGRYDLVLVDLELTDGTGDELAKWIRKQSALTARPIILAVSAFELPEVRARASAAEMDGFVGKPVTPEKLEAALLSSASGMTSWPGGSPASGPSYIDLLSGADARQAEALRTEAVREMRAEVEAMVQACSRRDSAEAAWRAHRMLSIALLIRDETAAGAARKISHAFKAGDLAGAAAQVEALAAEWLPRHTV